MHRRTCACDVGTYAHLSNDKVRMCLRVRRVQVEKEVVGISGPQVLTASVPATSATSSWHRNKDAAKEMARITDSVSLRQWQVMQARGPFRCRWHEAWR